MKDNPFIRIIRYQLVARLHHLSAATFIAEKISSSGIKYGEAIQTDFSARAIIEKKIFLITLHSLSGPPAISWTPPWLSLSFLGG